MIHIDTSHGAADHAHAVEAKPSYDDINTSLVVMVGIVSAILTYLSVVVVQAMTYQWDMNMIRKRSYDVQYTKSVDAIKVQKEQLEANPSIERLSIEQAMTETVAAFTKNNSSQ
jgi:hypothetical protein